MESKYETNELIYETHKHGEEERERRDGEGMDREFEIRRCKLLHIWIE